MPLLIGQYQQMGMGNAEIDGELHAAKVLGSGFKPATCCQDHVVCTVCESLQQYNYASTADTQKVYLRTVLYCPPQAFN